MTFFVENVDEPITGDDFYHIKNSLRKKVGDIIRVNSQGFDYNCKITSLDKCVYFDIIDKEISVSEPNISVTLYQAMPKGDKFEYIIQKSVEVGVSEIVPIETEFTVVNAANFNKKIERYNKISKEAAKQSNRGIIPEIKPVQKLENVLQNIKNNGIIFYEEYFNSKNFRDFSFNAEKVKEDNGKILLPKNLNIVVGSEGGFSENEINLAMENGIPPVWLGKRILRCETAPLVVLSIIMYKSGNL
jgi:16S rRNA (uracil1498-N3)-methyltransferase